MFKSSKYIHLKYILLLLFLLMKIGRAAFLKNDFVPNNEGELPTLACLLTFMPCRLKTFEPL